MTILISDIKRTVAAEYGLSVRALVGPRHMRRIAHPRMIAVCLARELTGKSFPDIAYHFGGRDHSTAINACRVVNEHPVLHAQKTRLAAIVLATPNWRARFQQELSAANIIARALDGLGE